MADPFADRVRKVSDQGEEHFLITPDDDEDLPVVPKALYCRAAGTVMIRDRKGVDLDYVLQQGQVLPFRGVRVLQTGTTGTWYGII